MNSKRLHTILLATIALLFITLLVGTYQTNKLLTKRAATLTSLKAKSAALAQQQLALAKAKQQVKKYAELQQISNVVVPEDKNQAQAVREISSFADDNNVHIGSITFPASTLGSTVGGAANGVTGSTLPTAPSPTALSGTSKNNALSQLTPVPKIPGVYNLQINIQSDAQYPVAYAQFSGFLSDLEQNRRTAQVTNLTLQPDTKNRNLITFTLTLNEFIKP